MLRGILGVVLLILAGQCGAHILNMTEIRVAAAPQSPMVVSVRIDLGQSLMTAEQYWQAVTSEELEQQRLLLQAAILQLESGLRLYVEGRAVPLIVTGWQLEAVSLGAIRNPLTPQMAWLELATVDPVVDASILELQVSDSLQLPWPSLVRFDTEERLPVSRLLTAERRSTGSVGESESQGLWVSMALYFQSIVPEVTWLAVGFQHILPMGLDHIVFILGLFFLSTRASVLLLQVSAFTLAHSLTLGLATLGWVAAPAGIVEPLIALSIIYVALDNLYAKHLERWRLAVVTLFGLLHGLGFASALNALALPADAMFTALLLFNVGVELGQLTVLLLALATVGWLRRWVRYRECVAEPASLTIAGVCFYWLIKRLAF